MRMLVLITVTALAGMVYTERCANTADCVSQAVTDCQQNSTLICATAVHMCVCIVTPVGNSEPCIDKSDCTKCGALTEPHCVDRRCKCALSGPALLG